MSVVNEITQNQAALGATTDVINHLAGLNASDSVAHLRALRPAAVEHAQRSYDVLLAHPLPESVAHFDLAERYAVAVFTALLHQAPLAADFYGQALQLHEKAPEADRLAAITALAHRALQARAHGPWGQYPAGVLSQEDDLGPSLNVSPQERAVLGERVSAALEHTHLLVFHPRDASPQALAALADHGWSTQGMVTLSQLVSFLAFQLRVVHGLRVLTSTFKD